MTDSHSRQPSDLLEEAIAALRATPVPAGPSAELIAATNQGLHQAHSEPAPGRPLSRRNQMLRLVRLASIAVAAAILLTFGIMAVARMNSPHRKHDRPAPIVPIVEKTPTQVEVDGAAYHIQGPFTHEDLTVFLLCSDHQDTQDFLTLDEGLKEGLVTVTEQEHEQVRALWIDNHSDRPLYLQEGERLLGGKQDRTIISSLVIPPKSGRTSVPTFCVEHSRWAEGKKGKEFGFSVNPALAPKGVRGAAKVEGSQDRVWGCVAAQKDSAQKKLKCPNTNSSVNEMLDSPQVQTISEEYAAALSRALDRAENSSAMGVAIVFNGQIEEVDLYPNQALLRKLFPRLIRAYAVQAALLKDQTNHAEPPRADDFVQFLQERDAKSQKKNTLDQHNDVQVSELANRRFQCTTRYNGQSIHWQMMAKNRESGTSSALVLGSDW